MANLFAQLQFDVAQKLVHEKVFHVDKKDDVAQKSYLVFKKVISFSGTVCHEFCLNDCNSMIIRSS